MTRSAYTERNIPFTAAEIFGAFEDPAKLAKWWGPDGFASTFETFEFSENGPWKFIMHGPNGVDYPNEMVFREIDRNRKIVVDHIVSPLFTLTITLTPRGDGTFLTWNQEFENEEVLKRVMAIVGPANEQNLNRLTAVLNGELP
jgi:uncharacterized protein YndB with AHSA1/START domain